MKKYIKPAMTVKFIDTEDNLLTSSDTMTIGVQEEEITSSEQVGSKKLNGYTSDDLWFGDEQQ